MTLVYSFLASRVNFSRVFMDSPGGCIADETIGGMTRLCAGECPYRGREVFTTRGENSEGRGGGKSVSPKVWTYARGRAEPRLFSTPKTHVLLGARTREPFERRFAEPRVSGACL